MLELFPQEKITDEVRASFQLMVTAFVNLAEELLWEEQELQGPDDEEQVEYGQTPAIPTVIDNRS